MTAIATDHQLDSPYSIPLISRISEVLVRAALDFRFQSLRYMACGDSLRLSPSVLVYILNPVGFFSVSDGDVLAVRGESVPLLPVLWRRCLCFARGVFVNEL